MSLAHIRALLSSSSLLAMIRSLSGRVNLEAIAALQGIGGFAFFGVVIGTRINSTSLFQEANKNCQ